MHTPCRAHHQNRGKDVPPKPSAQGEPGSQAGVGWRRYPKCTSLPQPRQAPTAHLARPPLFPAVRLRGDAGWEGEWGGRGAGWLQGAGLAVRGLVPALAQQTCSRSKAQLKCPRLWDASPGPASTAQICLSFVVEPGTLYLPELQQRACSSMFKGRSPPRLGTCPLGRVCPVLCGHLSDDPRKWT